MDDLVEQLRVAADLIEEVRNWATAPHPPQWRAEDDPYVSAMADVENIILRHAK